MDTLKELLNTSLDVSVKAISTLGSSIAETSKSIVGPTICKMASQTSEKLGEFYQNNKEIVITTTVAATVYLTMKRIHAWEKDQYKRKQASSIKVSTIRPYMSEPEEVECPQNTTKEESKYERVILSEQPSFRNEQWDSENEEECDDKIFFHMYQAYKHSD